MSDFESYCSRMWLDYCDENNTLHSECLSKDAYVERWYDWLLDKYQNRDYKEDIVPENFYTEKRQNKDKALLEAWQKKEDKDKGYQPYHEEDPLSIQEEIDLFRTDPNS